MGKRINKPYYNITNTCDNIKKVGFSWVKCENKLISNKKQHPYREYNEDGSWTGKWLCHICRNRNDYIERYQIGHRRTGNLDPNSSNAKGDLFQDLTCRWRSTISIIPVEDLNKKLDNYKSAIDHTEDTELGIIQTQGRLYSSTYKWWNFDCRKERNNSKQFDVMICYCTSKNGKNIERLYIFPKKEIMKRDSITIQKNTIGYRGIGWYEQYRITSEETLKLVNKIWKKIIGEMILNG